jgi:hypothetical protein
MRVLLTRVPLKTFSPNIIFPLNSIFATYLLQAYFGLGRPAAGRGLRPLLTQLATPILTSKIGLGDESGPDIRWWEKGLYCPWLG